MGRHRKQLRAVRENSGIPAGKGSARGDRQKISQGNKPISEIAPQASKNLQGGKKFWLHLAPENFLPKFCDQLIGLKPGETRLVIVNFPDEFPVKELAGKKADYAVTLREIKDK